MKKSLVLLLSIWITISLISFNIVKTSAEDKQSEPEHFITINELTTPVVNNENDVIEIPNIIALKTFLSSKDTKEGILTGNSYIINESITVYGTKTLNLNGKTIKADNLYSGNMFEINGTLIINDSTVSEQNPFGLGAIDGNYIEETYTHSDFIRGFYVSDGATLKLNAGTIENMYVYNDDYYSGGAIYNDGNVVIKNGLINNCLAYNGGAIYNSNLVEISGGTIQKCIAHCGGAINNYGYDNKVILKISGGIIDSCKAIAMDYYPDGGAIENYAEIEDADLIITGGTIQNCESEGYGGAIYNDYDDAYATINISGESKITNCKADWNGGAIANYDSLTIDEGTIEKCSSKNHGGAIANGLNLVINGGSIDNCYSQWYGGAIYNKDTLEINGGTIYKCVSNERGGAIYSDDEWGANELPIKDVEISSCSSPYSAVYCAGTDIKLEGKTKFSNTNEQGNKDDICLTADSYIEINDGFDQEEGDTISIWTPTGNINKSTDEYEAIVKKSYTGTIETLYDIFKSAHGQEYIIKDAVNDKLKLKAVNIIQEPNFNNGYTVKTNVLETVNPIKVSYQWYKSIIDKETNIFGPGNYSIGTTNFILSEAHGTYDDDTKTWSMDVGSEEEEKRIFEFNGLKKGQVISFDYKTDSQLSFLLITLDDVDDNYYQQYITNNSTGKYSAVIPEELDGKEFYVKFEAYDKEDATVTMKVNNICAKERQDAEVIKDATSATLVGAEQKADNFCRLKFENIDDGAVNYVDSFDVNFGAVLTGDNQIVKRGVTPSITFETDLSVSDIEIYVDSVSTDTKLTNGQDYAILLPPGNELKTCTLTMKTDSKKIPTGNHKYYIKSNSKSGYETIIFSLNVKGDSPTPTPTPEPSPVVKDESCEKVIGPTWHWNNKKGICEDAGSVKTNTK